MKFKRYAAVFAAAISAAAILTFSSSAASANGLNVSKTSASEGDKVKVTIFIPASENADTASIRVEFDPNVFTVVEWSPEFDGSDPTSNYGEGFFALSDSNAYRVIDLHKGTTLTATLKVNDGAEYGDSSIRITGGSLTYVKDNGYEYEEVWSPEVTEVSVTIKKKAASTAPTVIPDTITTTTTTARTTTAAPYEEPAETTTTTTAATTYYTDNIPATTAYYYTGTPSIYTIVPDKFPTVSWDTDSTLSPPAVIEPGTAAPAASETVTSVSEDTTETKKTTKTTAKTTKTEKTEKTTKATKKTTVKEKTEATATEDSDADTTKPVTTTTAKKTARPEETPVSETGTSKDDTTQKNPVKKWELTLRNDLQELRKGDIRANTKYSFFNGNTEMVLSNPESAAMSAVTALYNAGLTGHTYYAFDISVFDKNTGAAIRQLDNGYIEFTLPIPKVFEGSVKLAVFHIENGVPEKVESGIVERDGAMSIRLVASKFSPYMIVDMNERPEVANGLISEKGTRQPGYDGNVNPNTGAAAAVAIPAAIAGCVLLAKKPKVRRRKPKRQKRADKTE